MFYRIARGAVIAVFYSQHRKSIIITKLRWVIIMGVCSSDMSDVSLLQSCFTVLLSRWHRPPKLISSFSDAS